MDQLAVISVPGFSATATFAGDELLVRMRGNADLEVQPELASFLPEVHAAALKRAASEVTVDLREVEFMNSSCIKELVSWLQRVLDLAPDRRYRMRLQQGTQHWQTRSLLVLKAFAGDLVDIER